MSIGSSPKDGRTVWIRDEAAPVRGLDGTLLYWRGVMLDITERKEAEEKLRWSLDVLRRTLQQRRELARRLQNAQESERQRIAADIHDDPIQVMSAIDMRLQTLAEFPSSVTPEAIAGIETEVARGDRAAPLDALRAPSRRPRPGGPRSRAPACTSSGRRKPATGSSRSSTR